MCMSRLPQWLSGKEAACNAGAAGLIPGLGRSPGGGHSSPLLSSCLENSVDRGAWQVPVHGVAKHDWSNLARMYGKSLGKAKRKCKTLSPWWASCVWEIARKSPVTYSFIVSLPKVILTLDNINFILFFSSTNLWFCVCVFVRHASSICKS